VAVCPGRSYIIWNGSGDLNKIHRLHHAAQCVIVGGLAALYAVSGLAQNATSTGKASQPATKSPDRTAYDWSDSDASPHNGPISASQHVFVMHGKGKIFDEKTEVDELKLSATQTDGRYTIQDELWHPGYTIKPHYHKVHAETFYLISGKFEWTVGGETHLMTAGDLVYIPPKTVHSVRVIGAEDAHVLFIDQPGGYEESEEHERSFTAEQLAQPQTQRLLRELSDIYPVTDPGSARKK